MNGNIVKNLEKSSYAQRCNRLKAVITIDTEEDSWGQTGLGNYSVKNIEAIHRIQNIFNRYGAIPTYLVTYSVAKDLNGAKILRTIHERGLCEIGTHCHPWSNPPFRKDEEKYGTMLCDYPGEMILEKIELLHKAINQSFQIIPKSFRAGRYGFSPKVAECIISLGYRIDTSMTPFWDWRGMGGPDFWNTPTHPYRFDPSNIFREISTGRLLEIPLSIGFLQANQRQSARMLRFLFLKLPPFLRLIGFLDRIRVLNRRFLSPEERLGHDLIPLAKSLIKNGNRILNLTFHSSTLIPGKTPFVRNDADLNIFLKNLDCFFEFLSRQDTDFIPISRMQKVLYGS